MRNREWKILILVLVFFAACSSTQVDPSKPEMSVQERHSQPPKTFNQFHKDWDY